MADRLRGTTARHNPNSNRVLLSLSDIAQLLIAGGYLDVPYALPQPIYFRYSTSSKVSPWHQLTHLHLSYSSTGYQLNVQPALDSVFPVSSAPTFTNVIAFAPDHPLLACAPALPSYMQMADAPFLTKTVTALSAEHSRGVIKSLARDYPFPAEFLDDWSLPLTLTLKRLWPTVTEPNRVELVIEYASVRGSSSTPLKLPHYASDLAEAPYSGLHRTFWVAFLFSRLVPPQVSLADHQHSPWLVQAVEPTWTSATQLCMNACPAYPSLSSLAYHKITESNYYITPNPLGEPPALQGNIPTVPEPLGHRSWHISDLWPEKDFKNPTPTELFSALNRYATELRNFLHEEHTARLSC